MDGISWIGGKSEDSPKLMGERLGLYICAAGGALFGTMTWGAALATHKYADEIRRSCVRNEALIQKNTSKLDDIVRRLSAVNSGLNGGVSLLNDVSAAIQRGWKQNVTESRQVSDETADRLKKIADANGQALHRVEQAAAKLEDTHKQQDAFVGTLNAVAQESQRRIQNWHDSMEKESQKIEQVSRTLYAGQHELSRSIHGVKVATDNLTTEHAGFKEGLNQLNTLQREWKGMNSENIKMINRLLSQKSALPSELMLKDVTWKKMNVSEPRRVNSSPAAKKGNADESDSSSQHTEKSWHASDESVSSASDHSFDPEEDDYEKYTLNREAGKLIRAPRPK
jgi:hypothetical protein